MGKCTSTNAKHYWLGPNNPQATESNRTKRQGPFFKVSAH